MLKTANDVTEHINEETDVELELTNLRCHLDCIADAETIEDSRANVVESIKSLQYMLTAMQSVLSEIDNGI